MRPRRWLLDKMGRRRTAQIDTGKLASLSKERRRIPARLDPADKQYGLLDKKWNLLVNTDISRICDPTGEHRRMVERSTVAHD